MQVRYTNTSYAKFVWDYTQLTTSYLVVKILRFYMQARSIVHTYELFYLLIHIKIHNASTLLYANKIIPSSCDGTTTSGIITF